MKKLVKTCAYQQFYRCCRVKFREKNAVLAVCAHYYMPLPTGNLRNPHGWKLLKIVLFSLFLLKNQKKTMFSNAPPITNSENTSGPGRGSAPWVKM
jgi:hypothetical protein